METLNHGWDAFNAKQLYNAVMLKSVRSKVEDMECNDLQRKK